MIKVNKLPFVLLAVLIVTALLVGGVFIYSLVTALVSIIMLSYLSGKGFYKNIINILWKNDDRVQVGDKVKIEMEFYNSGIFPIPYLKVRTNFSKRLTGEQERDLVYSIMPASKTLITKEFVCKNKGIYQIGYAEVEFGDAMGIFKWKKIFQSDVSLYVYPKVHNLKGLSIPFRQNFGTVPVNHSAYEDFASVRDIRKYAMGDSFKKIHWKVTAHKGEFYVKNLELNATADINVFWDLHHKNYVDDYADDIEELGAECAVSIIRYALNNNMSVSLYAKDQYMIKLSGTGIARYPEFLDQITKSQINGDTLVWELVKREAQKLNLGATAIVITPQIDDIALEVLLGFKAKGIEFAVVYLCRSKELVNNNVEALRQRGILVNTISLNDDIRLVLGGS
ncbi:MAG TPA: DUF58 domain-containing protein [Patescibacteria group bacterium]|nr:DUF58 domain-containing protein [Patescibacteria group bacterium]